jgi:hypothetical protein
MWVTDITVTKQPAASEMSYMRQQWVAHVVAFRVFLAPSEASATTSHEVGMCENLTRSATISRCNAAAFRDTLAAGSRLISLP